VSRRAEVLELAVLGLLHDSPMHGYELRKRLNAVLGAFRALSYGTLYPALKTLLAEGLIREAGHVDGPAPALAGKRARIVYELTAEGKERFQSLVRQPGPAAWEDETFDVHFAFFARTDAATRLQILEGRRTRLQERLDGVRQSMARNRERRDSYTLELQRHGLESVEREVRWLSELIDTERASNMTHLDDPDRPRGSPRGAAASRPPIAPASQAERPSRRRRTE
jgi:DNA-binding PadR family transcriptional regulator